MNAKWRVTFAVCAVFGLVVSTGALSAKDGGTRFRAKLAGPAISGQTPSGEAEFESNASKGRSSLEVEVEHVNLPAATMLDVVLVHGGVSTTVGQITLKSTGEGELELQSEDGATVPAVVKGDTVLVQNAGVGILSGTL